MTAAQKRGRAKAGRAGAQALARYRAEQAAIKQAQEAREKKRVVYTLEVALPMSDVEAIGEIIDSATSRGEATVTDVTVRS